jgi:bifunctional non-homologous end joining protein LigD
MSLEKYKQKRKFNETPERQGKTGTQTRELIFTVQRHHASHLHYDFRLEMDGVLKSWAIPKGPSMNPGDKRLAMMVEDHPYDYALFEGDIPAGNYGAGHVDVWDHGTYNPIDEKGNVISEEEALKHLNSGSIKFRLKGKKLKGDFALAHMKNRGNAWLLIKHKDKYAIDKPYDSEDYASKSSLQYTAQRNAKTKTVKKK